MRFLDNFFPNSDIIYVVLKLYIIMYLVKIGRCARLIIINHYTKNLYVQFRARE